MLFSNTARFARKRIFIIFLEHLILREDKIISANTSFSQELYNCCFLEHLILPGRNFLLHFARKKQYNFSLEH